MEFTSAAGPWPESAPEPQPELRAGLESLGFQLLGAQVVTMPPSELAKLVDGYAPEHHETFLQWISVPAQVLAAPDGSAFARLSWFWWGRNAELSTVLPDGQLVTTVTAWGVDPPWPRKIQRAYARTTDRLREQVLDHADAASLRIVDGDAAELWTAHRDFVASVVPDTSRLPPHTDLTDAVELYQASHDFRARLAERAVLVAWPIWMALLAVLGGVFALLHLTVLPPQVFDLVTHPAGLAVVAALAVLGTSPALRAIALRTRHWPVRGRFRAPVPRVPRPAEEFELDW